MRVWLLLLVILCFSAPRLGLSQKIQKKLKFKRVEANVRLSNSNITAIFQDSRGFIWVGTDDGLNRFDGYDFKIYRNVDNDSASLVKNKIQCIFEDSRGTLWISSLNSGLHSYDRTHDNFRRVPEFSKPHCQVMRIMEDNNHNLWIGGVIDAHAFVAMLNPADMQWKTYLLFKSTDAIYSMAQYSEDEFWLGTRLNGLYKWNKKTGTLEHELHDPKKPEGIPGNYIEKILKAPRGDVWIATRSGLGHYDPATGKFKTLRATTNGSGLPTNDIMDICLDDKVLWIATENGGLSRMDLATERFTNFHYDKNDPHSIINNSIWCLHRDRQGRIWIGSYAKGLCVLDVNEEKFTVLDIPLENDLINAVLKDSKGRFWIGTEDGVLLYEKNRLHHFRHDPLQPNSLSSNAVNCLYEDSRHQIWTGHWNGGLNRFDEAHRNFIRYTANPNRPGSLTNANVFSIVESTATGELLVATFGGLHILKDQRAGIFENINDYPHEGDQLMLTLTEDHNKNVWVGSYSGLGLFDRTTNKIKRFNITSDTTEANDRVNCIFEDSKKRLWIGSYGGLHQMVDEHTFITYTIKDGLPVNLVHFILEDSRGNLWLGTSHGLTVFNPGGRTFKTYDESDGLVSVEFRRKAFCKSGDGRMFVGGHGLNAFYPDSINGNPNVPPVFLTDLKVFNQSVVPNGKDGILKDAISATQEITLNHDHAFISIHYVGINYTASYKNQYAYMLEGFDAGWNYVGTQRFATFTNLNPGTYTFRVKASNNDGIWNEEGASLVIHVLPPWHQALWFRAIAIGFCIFIITIAYYLRVGSVERQNAKLEELVDLRTRELREKNEQLAVREQELIHSQEETSTQRDQLADQNKQLEEASKIIERKNLEILKHNETLEGEVEKRTRDLLEHNHQLEQFAFISAHNLRAPVARILGLGEVLKFAADPQEEKMIREKLIHTTQELDTVVKDLNKILEIRKDSTSVISEIQLSQEMSLVRTTLEKEIEDTQAHVNENFNGIKAIQSVKPYVDSILMNLVSNAIKYRDPGRIPVIDVSAETAGDFICLSVRDNGLGIDLSRHTNKLFKLYSRFHMHVEGKGMGLYLVKTQVSALGGRIEAVRNPDNGMTFKVFLPLKVTQVAPC